MAFLFIHFIFCLLLDSSLHIVCYRMALCICIKEQCLRLQFLFNMQEELLPGGHGLMVRGYIPVINTLAKGLDIHLNHRY